MKIVIIGGGAAGIFAAVRSKKMRPQAEVSVLEKTAQLLAKVKISGGGRCNVTHHLFDPLLLSRNYPRGEKALIGPFNRFGPKDTINWFESRGVPLKAERDGRMFPTTDNSETIIECLLAEAKTLGVQIFRTQKIDRVAKNEHFEISLREGEILSCDKLILATGSSKVGFEWAKSLGHTIHEPVPSLFTFNIPQSPLSGLSGVSFDMVALKVNRGKLDNEGPLLITHFGFSGPAVLKLSAQGARFFAECGYKTRVVINWLPGLKCDEIKQRLLDLKAEAPQKGLYSENLFYLPKRFWKRVLEQTGLDQKKLRGLSDKELGKLAEKLHSDTYLMSGKTTNKEEFVTCGGVTLNEVNFKTMESKLCPGLYFAGEILNIDGVTGGFNFQSAWTTGFIAGSLPES